ncbi:CRISPR-associated protein Cas5t [Parafrankia irregularis]|uniref:CRISPR-associated protein Cas5t n=1 Tax=Parafrankia irregularis TaxID=795642 RepID=A0A0S4QJI7_9ACTN|nr:MULTISPECIES: CRISPR-associated protein Cas5 [Parafrankia]MBE3205662.1 CRISPR-associated protein Cas5 [Parafrankia sp. CH37]CUU55438.1 CRISPR-associated protein Cas5t [Parafrankia irregularis]
MSTGTAGGRSVQALRVELYAPVASFRDPMFPRVTRCLPVPPPSTVRGMLAAASGNTRELAVFGMAASSSGHGVDLETYHPIAADGSNPAIAGRVRTVKGGATVRERPFLTDVRLTLWIPEADGRRLEPALRRPVWGLRLGRSQDVVHLDGVPCWTELHPAGTAGNPAEGVAPMDGVARVGHALAPPDGHCARQAVTLRLAETVSSDRLRTSYGSYLWCREPGGLERVSGSAYRDDEQAVWLFDAAGDL